MVNLAAISLHSLIAAGTIGSGSIYSIQDKNGLCVDHKGYSSVDYDPIIAYGCHLQNSGDNQKWNFTLVAAPSTFKIRNVNQPNSVLAYPTTGTSSQYQGAVARINSDITWKVTASATGNNNYTLVETYNGGALTTWGSPLTVEILSGTTGSAAQTFMILPA